MICLWSHTPIVLVYETRGKLWFLVRNIKYQRSDEWVRGVPRPILIAETKGMHFLFHLVHSELQSDIGKCINQHQESADFSCVARVWLRFRANADVEKTTKKFPVSEYLFYDLKKSQVIPMKTRKVAST